jgi:hypothetical protein
MKKRMTLPYPKRVADVTDALPPFQNPTSCGNTEPCLASRRRVGLGRVAPNWDLGLGVMELSRLRGRHVPTGSNSPQRSKQSAHSSVVASKPCRGPLRWITWALNTPMIV